jgi:predicted DNA-binding protein (MmcQ/YjbR family)
MKSRPSGKKPARPAAKEAAARKNTGKAKAPAGKPAKAAAKATTKPANKATQASKASKASDKAGAKAAGKPAAKVAGKPAAKSTAKAAKPVGKPPRGNGAPAKLENGASEEVAGHVEPLTASETAALLEHVRAIVRRLPETTEVEAWGHPTFRVKDKIFVGYGVENGGASLGVKTTPDMQAALVSSDPRFSIAAYVGKHGWVSMSLAGAVDLAEVEALVRGSYRLVAPSKLVQRLDAED